MSNKKNTLGFLTFFTTTSDSCDHYSYTLRTAKKPTSEQLDWWLKANASDVDDEYCYESIDDNLEIINLDELPEMEELPTQDENPEIEFSGGG